MKLIVVVDTSLSMVQVTHIGLSLLEIAKSTAEMLATKARFKTEIRMDKFALVTDHDEVCNVLN